MTGSHPGDHLVRAPSAPCPNCGGVLEVEAAICPFCEWEPKGRELWDAYEKEQAIKKGD